MESQQDIGSAAVSPLSPRTRFRTGRFVKDVTILTIGHRETTPGTGG